MGHLDGLGRVDDDDAGPAPDGLAVAQQVVVVAGDEGVVAGHQVAGEVVDVGDLLAPFGHERRVVLLEVRGLVSLAQEDLAQEGVDGGDVVVVEEEVRPAQAGVAEPERPRDVSDGWPLAEPSQVALPVVVRRPFLVDLERGGDPQADPAAAPQLGQLVDLGAVRLGLGRRG